MMRPPPGYYRKHMPPEHSAVRLARTDQPMSGVVRHPELAAELARHFEGWADAHAPYYVDGLKTGKLVPVTEVQSEDRYWRPGELFLRS